MNIVWFYFWWALIWKECQEYSAKCVLLLLSLMKLKGRTLGIIYAPSNLLSHFLEVRSIINKSINLVCVNPKVIYFIFIWCERQNMTDPLKHNSFLIHSKIKDSCYFKHDSWTMSQGPVFGIKLFPLGHRIFDVDFY